MSAEKIKQLGTPVKVGLSASVSIPGVVIRTAVSISEGYLNITPIPGDSGATENVVMSDPGIDISVSGHLSPEANYPKNGDAVTIAGYAIGWIDGVSCAETPNDKVAFSCTAHGRNPTIL